MKSPYVFLSYCRENISDAQWLHDQLVDAGFSVWWDKSILGGQDWRFERNRAMKQCFAVVACFSREVDDRGATGMYPELRDAIDSYRELPPGSVFVVPVRFSACRLPEFPIDANRSLTDLQYIDLFPSEAREDAVALLIKSLQAAPKCPTEMLATSVRVGHEASATRLISQLTERSVQVLSNGQERVVSETTTGEFHHRLNTESGQSLDSLQYHFLTVLSWSKSIHIMGMKRPKDLRSLYVELSLTDDPRKDRLGIPKDRTFTVKDALAENISFVILGDPGSGKTTTLKRLALDLVQAEAAEHTPIVVRLRDLATGQSLIGELQQTLGFSISPDPRFEAKLDEVRAAERSRNQQLAELAAAAERAASEKAERDQEAKERELHRLLSRRSELDDTQKQLARLEHDMKRESVQFESKLSSRDKLLSTLQKAIGEENAERIKQELPRIDRDLGHVTAKLDSKRRDATRLESKLRQRDDLISRLRNVIEYRATTRHREELARDRDEVARLRAELARLQDAVARLENELANIDRELEPFSEAQEVKAGGRTRTNDAVAGKIEDEIIEQLRARLRALKEDIERDSDCKRINEELRAKLVSQLQNAIGVKRTEELITLERIIERDSKKREEDASRRDELITKRRACETAIPGIEERVRKITRAMDDVPEAEVLRTEKVERLTDTIPHVITRCVASYLDSLNALLLLDGFDEVHVEVKSQLYREICELGRHLTRARIVLTCRSADFGYKPEGFLIYEIKPFSEAQIETFAHLWFSAEEQRKRSSAEFLTELHETPYRDLATRPLTLANLCLVFEKYGSLPEMPLLIYRKILNLLLEEWDAERGISRQTRYSIFDSYRKVDFLASLAYELSIRHSNRLTFSTSDLVDIYGKIHKRFRLPSGEARAVAAEIESYTGIVVRVSYEEYEFSHKSLQEYLAAEHLSRLADVPEGVTLLKTCPNELAVSVALSADPTNWFCGLFRNKGARVVPDSSWLTPFFARITLERPCLEPTAELGATVLWLLTRSHSPDAKAIQRFLRMPEVSESIRVFLTHCDVLVDTDKRVRVKRATAFDSRHKVPDEITFSRGDAEDIFRCLGRQDVLSLRPSALCGENREAFTFEMRPSLLLRDVVLPAIQKCEQLLTISGLSVRNINVRKKSFFEIPMLEIDRQKLVGVVCELIENSVSRAFPDRGTFYLDIQGLAEGAGYGFRLRDWGRGIDRDKVEALLHDDVDQRSQNDTTICLSAARAVVEGHGGKLSLLSVSCPTEFSVLLPRAVVACQASAGGSIRS